MRCNSVDFSDGSHGMNSDVDPGADLRCGFEAAADRDRDAAKSVAERRILYTDTLLGDRDLGIGMIRMALFLSQFIGPFFPISIN